MRAYAAVLLLGLMSTSGAAHDLKHLPLGDNLKSSAPERGRLWPCRIEAGARGAFRVGPWIDFAAGTFDKTAKAAVEGDVTWPHKIEIIVQGELCFFRSNGLPPHGTGIYPIQQGTAAFQYDQNPNNIEKQSLNFEIPAHPQLAARATCAPGAVGILINGGKTLTNADLDECHGHIGQIMWDGRSISMYHYHATAEFPYSIGCLRGSYERALVRTLSGPPPGWF